MRPEGSNNRQFLPRHRTRVTFNDPFDHQFEIKSHKDVYYGVISSRTFNPLFFMQWPQFVQNIDVVPLHPAPYITQHKLQLCLSLCADNINICRAPPGPVVSTVTHTGAVSPVTTGGAATSDERAQASNNYQSVKNMQKFLLKYKLFLEGIFDTSVMRFFTARFEQNSHFEWIKERR